MLTERSQLSHRKVTINELHPNIISFWLLRMNPPPIKKSLSVDIPSGKKRPIIATLLTVIVSDVLFLYHTPGASVGLFALFLGVLILLTRNSVPQHPIHFAAFGVLLISSLQSFRFISLSNFIVLITLLLSLSGHSAHTCIPKPWMRWFEGLLSVLRPLGALLTFGELKKPSSPQPGNKSTPIRYTLSVILPVLVVLLIFGSLLGAGNAVLGKWYSTFFGSLSEYLNRFELPGIERILAWGVFAAFGLIFACPPKPSTFSDRLGRTWS